MVKPSFVLGALVGYVLGARAGRERYEDIVALARRVAGSQTIQSTAGVLQAQAGEVAGRARDRLIGKIPLVQSLPTHNRPAASPAASPGAPSAATRLNGLSGVNGVNGTTH